MVDLISELKSLRKGRGVLAGQVERRVGPALRAACGITERDAPWAVRRKVRTWLTDLIGRLPEDLREPTMVAFALDSDARLPLYQDRVHWMAERVDRDPRTVRRRVDIAIDQLAELAITEHDPALPRSAAWRTAELRIAAVFDGDRPEIFEHRTVVAERDGLHEIAVPALWRGARARVLFGGSLLSGPEPAIALAGPVGRGGEHTFAVAYRVDPATAPRHIVVTPSRPWELLDVRVRFGAQRPPRVWALSGTVDNGGIARSLDMAGEARLRVLGTVPGLSYGLRW